MAELLHKHVGSIFLHKVNIKKTVWFIYCFMVYL